MTPLSKTAFERLQQLDTCSVSNAIERFNVRLRNEGFVSGPLTCRFPEYYDRMDLELVHGDRSGVHIIPPEVAEAVPDMEQLADHMRNASQDGLLTS